MRFIFFLSTLSFFKKPVCIHFNRNNLHLNDSGVQREEKINKISSRFFVSILFFFVLWLTFLRIVRYRVPQSLGESFQESINGK